MFNNSGNIGVSLITLVFSGAPYVIGGKTPYLGAAMAVQIIVLVFQNITANTLGIYYASRASASLKASIIKILSMPSIYAIPAAFLLKYLKVDVTNTPVWPALVYVKDGMVPVVLLTLGIQLSKTRFDIRNINVSISVTIRLIVGPMLAVLLIFLMGFKGIIAQTLLISYSVPTAVNTALIAIECNNNEDFAAQAVMVSTIFSAVTLTFVIFAARILYPV
jgi:predicted permease